MNKQYKISSSNSTNIATLLIEYKPKPSTKELFLKEVNRAMERISNDPYHPLRTGMWLAEVSRELQKRMDRDSLCVARAKNLYFIG